MRLRLVTALVVLLVGPLACGSEDTGASGVLDAGGREATEARAGSDGGTGGGGGSSGTEIVDSSADADASAEAATSIDAPADVSSEAAPEAADATSNDVTDAMADQALDAAPLDATADQSVDVVDADDGGVSDAQEAAVDTDSGPGDSSASVDAEVGVTDASTEGGVNDGGSGDAGADGGGGPTWSNLPLTGDPLSPRHGHSAVLGPGGQIIYIFGGQGYHQLDSDVVAYAWQTNQVTAVPSVGNAPSPRLDHVAVLDTVRSRMIVLGGRGYHDLYNDVYALDLSAGAGAWTRLAPGGAAPLPREGHVAVFDAANDRLVLFGGRGFHDLYADTWELHFGTSADGVWTKLAPSGLIPAARTEAAVTFDPITSRMFVGGGHGYHDVLIDMAVLDLTTANGSWSLQSPAPFAPKNGVSGAWIWDEVAHALFQFSGQAYYGLLNVAQTVDLASGLPGSLTSSPLGAPQLVDAALVHVPSAHAAFLICGQGYHELSGSIHRMNF